MDGNMLNSVSSNLRVQWEIFNKTEQQKWDSEFLTSVQYQTLSEEMIPIILSNSNYRMFRYLDENGNYKIGYGYSNPDKIDGYTEPEAYTDWIKELKRKEDLLQKQLPVLSLSQSQFDAILSLYFLTGNWKTIEGTEGTYNLFNAIRIDDWVTVANMLANASENRDQRLIEAKLIMVGDYTFNKTRTWVRNEGIQYTRTQYISGIDDSVAKRQAEFAYYRQTNGAFLPNMNELKKREIINTYSKNS